MKLNGRSCTRFTTMRSDPGSPSCHSSSKGEDDVASQEEGGGGSAVMRSVRWWCVKSSRREVRVGVAGG